MKIALATYQLPEEKKIDISSTEDQELIDYLTAKGIDIQSEIWNDVNVDWSIYQVVVIKSTWDYHEQLPAFKEWLHKIQSLGLKILNPVSIIEWNSHKGYLKDIDQKGLPTFAGQYLPKGSTINENLLLQKNIEEWVIKPCVSAGALNTLRLNRSQFKEKEMAINELLQTEDFILQPFVEEIKNGEWSFLFFNNVFSHCILKTPKTGDFRVQHFYGGSISYPTPDPKHIEEASKYLSILKEPILYARVDGVMVNNQFRLMELELIEPYLFLKNDPGLMENFYNALKNMINN